MVDNPNYKNHLKPKQYEVCWNKGTEAPFSGKYHDCKDKASTSVSSAAIAYLPLRSYGMIRIEVMCCQVWYTFGHVFDDVPEPTLACATASILYLFHRREK